MEPSGTWLRRLGTRDRAVLGVELLRIGVGVVWALNLIFVVDPANDWFDPSAFATIAGSFRASTVGGPGLADFVASNAVFFAWALGILTAYLAFAFLLGFTTRLASLTGASTAAVFLWTQWGTIWAVPGGTDVGPHPLYLLIYIALFVARAGGHLSLDAWRGQRGRATATARGWGRTLGTMRPRS